MQTQTFTPWNPPHNLAFEPKRMTAFVPINTPWGLSDGCTAYGCDVTFHSTPGHGGFKVAPDLLATIPQDVLRETMEQNGLKGWFEEDVDWSIVALAFPERFRAEEVSTAWNRMVGAEYDRATEFWTRVATSEGAAVNRTTAISIVAKLARRRDAIIRWKPPGMPPVSAI